MAVIDFSGPEYESTSWLEIVKIRLDGGTQPREKLDQLTVDVYANDMKDGDLFPAVMVYYDGTNYWLADGFHRLHATLVVGETRIRAYIKMGTRREAVLYSCSANGPYGLRRSNTDKRRAVEKLLNDLQEGCTQEHHVCERNPMGRCWSLWSDREIAKHSFTSNTYVSRLRRELGLSVNVYRYAERDGATYKVDTTNIGVPNESRCVDDPSSSSAPFIDPSVMFHRPVESRPSTGAATSVPVAFTYHQQEVAPSPLPASIGRAPDFSLPAATAPAVMNSARALSPALPEIPHQVHLRAQIVTGCASDCPHCLAFGQLIRAVAMDTSIPLGAVILAELEQVLRRVTHTKRMTMLPKSDSSTREDC